MKKSPESNASSSSDSRDQFLRLAIAAATLGMTMGIPVHNVIAAPASETSEVAHDYPGRTGIDAPKLLAMSDTTGHAYKQPRAMQTNETADENNDSDSDAFAIRNASMAHHEIQREAIVPDKGC